VSQTRRPLATIAVNIFFCLCVCASLRVDVTGDFRETKTQKHIKKQTQMAGLPTPIPPETVRAFVALAREGKRKFEFSDSESEFVFTVTVREPAAAHRTPAAAPAGKS